MFHYLCENRGVVKTYSYKNTVVVDGLIIKVQRHLCVLLYNLKSIKPKRSKFSLNACL